MLSSEALKKIVAEARPLIEQQLDLTEQVAGLRDVVTAAGGDWSQLKALVKAQIQDERDEAGDGKRVRKILDKADYAASYADMLGLANMNEKNSFAEGVESIDPHLLAMLIEGSQTAAGLSIITAALKAVQAGETDFQPDTGEVSDGVGGSDTILRSGREEASHLAHNQEIAGSSPAPATTSEVPRHEVEEAGEGEVTPPVSSVPHSEPASPPSEKAEPGDRRAEASPAATVVAGNVMTFRTHNPETHFLNSTGLLRLHGCLKPELCGSSEPRKRLCFDCSRLHDGPVHQDQAEAG